MRQILVLNDLPKQVFRIAVENYDFAEITIEFSSAQYAWYYSLTWGETFSIKNDRIACSPNLMRQYSDLVPFGILVKGPDGIDPFSISAWIDGWEMYFLDATDLQTVEALYV